MNLLIRGLVVFLFAQAAWAGGITNPSQNYESVTCRGANGRISFPVIRGSFQGGLVSMKTQGSGFLNLTRPQLHQQLLQEGLLKSRPWDQRRFLQGIGVDPKTYVPSIGGQVTSLMSSDLIMRGLIGGTLDDYYEPAYAMRDNLESMDRTDIWSDRQKQIQILVDQLSTASYAIHFYKLTSGQKQCLEKKMIKNPYASEGSESNPQLIEICAKFIDISNESRELVATEYLHIDSCSL